MLHTDANGVSTKRKQGVWELSLNPREFRTSLCKISPAAAPPNVCETNEQGKWDWGASVPSTQNSFLPSPPAFLNHAFTFTFKFVSKIILDCAQLFLKAGVCWMPGWMDELSKLVWIMGWFQHDRAARQIFRSDFSVTQLQPPTISPYYWDLSVIARIWDLRSPEPCFSWKSKSEVY